MPVVQRIGCRILHPTVSDCYATKNLVRRTGESPRSHDLDIGLEAIECELEANLVITLAGASMRYEAVVDLSWRPG